MRLFKWRKRQGKRSGLVEKNYLYSDATGVVVKDANGMTNTTLIFKCFNVFEARNYLVWIENLYVKEDNTVEMKIGWSNGKNLVCGYQNVYPVVEDYQKMKVILELIKQIKV